MESNEKKLIQLRTKLEFYKKLDAKIDQLLNDKIYLLDYSDEVCNKIQVLEFQLLELKIEMKLSTQKWIEDEN